MTTVIILSIFLLGLLAWEILICEGAHLGKRFVTWLYNLTAHKYDSIKDFDEDWERRLLGNPIYYSLETLFDALILDVGAGTGRTARALFPRPTFSGSMVCLEPADRMLQLGRTITRTYPTRWLRGYSQQLPFPDDLFDMVISLEMLEFVPDPKATLNELVRVLRPSGWLLISNRVSKEAALILGRTTRRKNFPNLLESCSLTSVATCPWQVDYDLVWAQKPTQTRH